MVITTGRYWLFAGEKYYAEGGMRDFRGSHPTADEAGSKMQDFLSNADVLDGGDGWAHVLDTQTGRIIFTGTSENKGKSYVVSVEVTDHALVRDENCHCAWR